MRQFLWGIWCCRKSVAELGCPIGDKSVPKAEFQKFFKESNPIFIGVLPSSPGMTSYDVMIAASSNFF